MHPPLAQPACTLRAGLAVLWCTRRSVVAFPRSYRSLCPAVFWSCRRRVAAPCRDTRPCRRPLLVTIQNLYRDPSPCRARTALCVACAAPRVATPSALSWCIAVPYRSLDALYRDPKSPPSATIQFFFCIATQGSPSSRYKLCIAASSLDQAARCIASLLNRVGCTTGSIVAVPGRVAPPSWRAQPCVPAQPAVCLLSLLCACLVFCVPAQPAVCLLILLCADSAYCVHAQPAVCRLRLLCSCLACCVPQYSLLYCDSILENG